MKEHLLSVRRRIARRVYDERVHLADRARALTERLDPVEEPDGDAPLTFEEIKSDFIASLMDRKVHDCPMCNRGGKIVEDRLTPLVATELINLLRIQQGNGRLSVRVAPNHVRADGLVNEQALFLVSDTDSEKIIVGRVKTLALFGLVERKRKGWVEITEKGKSFAKDDALVRYRCFLFGGKPIAFDPEILGVRDLGLVPVGHEPIAKDDGAVVPAWDEVHPVVAGSEE